MDDSLNIFSRALNVYKKGGVPLFIKCVKEHLFQRNSAWWLVRDLSKPIQLYTTPVSVQITSDKYDDVLHYMKLKNYISEPEIEIASCMGHWFLGIVANGSVKGFCKCGFSEVYINDFQQTITLPKNLAFIYEYEIDESIRGKGVGYFFISTILHRFSSAGYDFAACHIPSWNIASFKVVEKCGFKKHHFVRFIKLLGVKFITRDISDLLKRKCIKYQ